MMSVSSTALARHSQSTEAFTDMGLSVTHILGMLLFIASLQLLQC